MSATATHESVLDRAAWQAMLEREDLDAAAAFVGVLTRDDFAARAGTLLVWRGTPDGASVSVRAHRGDIGADVAMLIVADRDALQHVLAGGLALVPRLVRRGRLHLYMLYTRQNLDEAGLAELVEGFGLVFPRH